MFTTDVRSICWRQVVAARSLISCQKFKEELLPPPILLHTSSYIWTEEEKEKSPKSFWPASIRTGNKQICVLKDRKVHLPLMERKYNFRWWRNITINMEKYIFRWWRGNITLEMDKIHFRKLFARISKFADKCSNFWQLFPWKIQFLTNLRQFGRKQHLKWFDRKREK